MREVLNKCSPGRECDNLQHSGPANYADTRSCLAAHVLLWYRVMMTTPNKSRTFSAHDFQTAIAAAQERAARIEADAHAERLELDRLAKAIARGTGDLTEQASEVTAPLARRLETVLRGPRAPLSLVDLAAAVKEPAERVRKELRRMRSAFCATRSLEDAPDARQIHNHGTDADPRWQWVLGDQTPTDELVFAVETMLRRRAYTFAELTAATGARRGRLSGVIVKFQREGYPIINDGGTPREYLWRLLPRKR